MNALVPFIRYGGEIAKSNPKNEKKVVDEETELHYASLQIEKAQSQKLLVLHREKKGQVSQKFETAKQEAETTESKAKGEFIGGILALFFAGLMILTCIGLVYWAIAPAFYQREEIAWLIAGGCGLSTAICGHLLLEYLSRVLNTAQLKIFIVLCSLTMLALCIGGSIFLGKARSLQWELQNQLGTDSALELEAKHQDSPVNIEQLKKEIEKLTSRALILMAITLDVVAAMLLFLGTHKIQRNRAVVHHSRNLKKLDKRVHKLEARVASIESTNKEAIRQGVTAGLRKGKGKGNLAVLIIVAVTFVASIVLFLLLSEGVVFAKEPSTHVLINMDVTGSTTRDRRENERAVLRIIDSLKPGDSFAVMLISEKTFTDPEYLLSAKMPTRAGYFKEQVVRAKKKLIREFRAKAEKLSESRCSTSILDGLYLFAELLKENPAERKVLVLLSDMVQTAQGITPAKLARDSDAILSNHKADNLIPDMHGIDVYVMGASTHGMNLKAWTQLKKFWQKYFAATGANLKAYSIGRGSIK